MSKKRPEFDPPTVAVKVSTLATLAWLFGLLMGVTLGMIRAGAVC